MGDYERIKNYVMNKIEKEGCVCVEEISGELPYSKFTIARAFQRIADEEGFLFSEGCLIYVERR